MSRRFSEITGFLRFVLRRANEDRCAQVAASLTYTTLLALVPLVTIAVTVFAAFPVFSELMIQLKIFILSNLVPSSAGTVITVYMQQFSEKAARLTALGIVFLAVTAFMLMRTIDQAFNTIWRIQRRRPLLQQFMLYWAVLTVGPVLIGGSLTATSYLVSFSLGLVTAIPFIGIVTLKIVPVVLTSIAFSLLYLAVPNRHVPPHHAVAGGVAAAAAFELMKKTFTLYITHFPSYTLVYGAFASFPIFLLWIYFSWLVVMLGAVFASALSHWRGGAWQRVKLPGWQFYDALRMLRALHAAQHSGAVLGLREFRTQVALGLEDMEEILEALSSAGVARRVAGGGWVLTRAPQDIHVVDIFRLFVFQPEQVHAPRQAADARIVELVERLAAQQQDALQMSLDALFSGSSARTELEQIETVGMLDKPGGAHRL